MKAGRASNFRRAVVRWWPWMAVAVGLVAVLIYWYRLPIFQAFESVSQLLTDRDRITAYVSGFGRTAPLVFMGVQVAQVILAPIPGEATGFIGGYLFGALAGCIYSSIALTIGSWLNFLIGRFMGKRWVRRMVPSGKLEKYDYLLRHQGMLIVFLLFLFPGFPKDYLCLFLGISTMPMRIFLLMAMIGRIPGTMMLSLQGAMMFEKNYLIFCVLVAVNLLLIYLGYRYRESLYTWVEKINGQPTPTIDDREQ